MICSCDWHKIPFSKDPFHFLISPYLKQTFKTSLRSHKRRSHTRYETQFSLQNSASTNGLLSCSVHTTDISQSKLYHAPTIYIHTYIIGHYNPSVRITVQLLAPLMLCALILYMIRGAYSLKSISNNRFFFCETFFMAGLFTFRVWPEIC